MLLMMHSIQKYAGLTATLVEFLVLVMDSYDPTKKDMIKQGVYNSLRIMVEKGVVRYANERGLAHFSVLWRHCSSVPPSTCICGKK